MMRMKLVTAVAVQMKLTQLVPVVTPIVPSVRANQVALVEKQIVKIARIRNTVVQAKKKAVVTTKKISHTPTVATTSKTKKFTGF